MMTANSLNGKCALISGATGGLGEAIARELAESGCSLFLTGRKATQLEKVAEGIGVANVKIHYAPCDLANPNAVRILADEALTRLGQIDILVNCAGVFLVKPFLETTDKDVAESFQVNVFTPFLLCRTFARHMAAKGWGRIVNIGSSSAYQGFAGTSLYCASKHALLGLSRSLNDEFKKHNVRTYCISPGSIQTEMGKKVKNQDYSTFLDPMEVAKYVTFAISFDGNLVSEEIRLNRVVIR